MRYPNKIIRVAAAFFSCLLANVAWAQNYPAKTIRVIIPGATGDTCDTMLRLIGHKFMEKTGYSFVMDNRPGAVGQIGLQFIAQAPADGYTIGCGQGGNMVIIPRAYKKVAYDSIKDFAPISLIASNYLALAVPATSQFKTTRELITFAKAQGCDRVIKP